MTLCPSTSRSPRIAEIFQYLLTCLPQACYVK